MAYDYMAGGTADEILAKLAADGYAEISSTDLIVKLLDRNHSFDELSHMFARFGEHGVDLDENLAKAKHRRTQELRASKIDFSDLQTSGGCSIEDTARRAASLDQLRLLLAHTKRRLAEEPWKVTKYDSGVRVDDCELSELEEVTLYDQNANVVLLATVERQCSMVELLASEEQPGDYFCSHWYAAVCRFVGGLDSH